MAMDYQTLKLIHLHGNERVPMHEGSHPDAAAHDPERAWMAGARIFRCSRCDEEVVVLPPGDQTAGTDPA